MFMKGALREPIWPRFERPESPEIQHLPLIEIGVASRGSRAPRVRAAADCRRGPKSTGLLQPGRFTSLAPKAKLGRDWERFRDMATLEELTERIRRAAASDVTPGQSVKLDLKGEGVIHVDGPAVTNEDRPADLTVTLAKRDLEALGKGELDPVRAMMTGRIKLSDMGQAMKLQPRIQALFAKAKD